VLAKVGAFGTLGDAQYPLRVLYGRAHFAKVVEENSTSFFVPTRLSPLSTLGLSRLIVRLNED